MFKENKDFYPTPENLVTRMFASLKLYGKESILEPSAGSGSLVEGIQKQAMYRGYELNNIDCIENDKNLQHILKGKGFRVVYDDFLTFETQKEYNLIVMNPPFSNGCQHILKAIEMQEKSGGAVICLLNAETLKNAYSNDRQLLNRKLEEYNATVEYIQDAFVDAERKTGVEVALIKLMIPSKENKSFILEGLKKAQEQKEYVESANTQVVENDLYKAIVNQYNLEIAAGVKLIKEYKAMSPFILSSFSKIGLNKPILSLKLQVDYDDRGRDELSINEFLRDVRIKYWRALFENPKFTGRLTQSLKNELQNSVETFKDYEFSLYNIYQLKIDMNNKIAKGIEDAIIALFEELGNKYSYYDECSKNIHLYNGWKTNKSYIINKKVIIPLKAWGTGYRGYGRYTPNRREIVDKLTDVEKCFNYLDGGLTEAVDLIKALGIAERNEETKNIELKYFTVTFYKKGTCHITFTNSELLKKFNILGSQHKGWLPPSYGKRKYKDMEVQEQEVVKEFEGEISYANVLSKADYYIFNGNQLNLLEEKSA